MTEPRPPARVPTLAEVGILSTEAVAAALTRLHADQAQLAAVEGALVDRLMTLLAQPAPAADELVDMPTAAQLLGIPESYARDLGRRGQLPVIRVGKKYVRVSRRALAAFMERGPAPAVDPRGYKLYSRRDGRRNPSATPPAGRSNAASARWPARRDGEHGRSVGAQRSRHLGSDGPADHPDGEGAA